MVNMKTQCSVLAILVCSTLATEYQVPKCAAGMYYNESKSECVKCSTCKPESNEVIRVFCDGHSDTVCGPFLEFDKFHQAPFINLLPSNNGSQEVYVTHELDILRHGGDQHVGKTTNHAPIAIRNGKWYTLAMALLGVLCFVSLFVIIYIILACFVCKKKRGEKEVIYDAEMMTPMQSPTQTFLPPRQQQTDRPMTSYTEESDDSSGGAVGGRLIAVPNVYVPYQQEVEAENSGQTVSSSSTNYVYFKAPQNANM